MEKASTTLATKDPQTHDFMNVDSFSQLPFIRPAPSTKSSASGIRLFGIDFSSTDTAARNSDSGESAATNHHDTGDPPIATNGESGRKFECHYCCRNFPTSQALGGHQNAHKRERQHAKRAHLHHHTAALIAAAGDHHHHLYGYPHHRPTSYYPSSTSPHSFTSSRFSSAATFSLHRNHHHPQPTINGSPLAVWRIPAAVQPHHWQHLNGVHHRDPHLQPVPLFSGSSSNSSRIEYSSGPKMMMSRIENSGQVLGFNHNDQFNRRASSRDQNVSLDLRL